MKICPKCRSPVGENQEYCVCGYRFEPYDSLFKNGNTNIEEAFEQIFNPKKSKE